MLRSKLLVMRTQMASNTRLNEKLYPQCNKAAWTVTDGERKELPLWLIDNELRHTK